MCDCSRGRHQLRDSEGRFRKHGTPEVTEFTRIRRDYLTYLDSMYLRAEEATRGHMLTMAGVRRGVRTNAWFTLRPPSLKYASDELKDWLEVHPVMSESDYRRWAEAEQEAYA